MKLRNALLFADNQAGLLDSDDDLQEALYTLHKTTQQIGMETFLLKPNQ
jgi:hypothetical protein